MKPKNQNQPPTDDDHLFDLLADGQLDEPRRRRLLTGLDERPGGWRRCALAFLEAQSWREAMDALTQPKGAAAAPRAQVAPPWKRRRRDYVTMLLGAAACIFLGVGLTMLKYDMQRGRGPGSTQMAGIIESEFPSDGQTGRPLLKRQVPRPGEQVHLVGLPARGSDGRRHTVGLPAVARDRIDEALLRNMPSAIPEAVARSFEQAGHEVHSSRQLLPFRMKDGRRLVVPVDQLDVHYASNPGYQ
jgi:hypothetical protein